MNTVAHGQINSTMSSRDYGCDAYVLPAEPTGCRPLNKQAYMEIAGTLSMLRSSDPIVADARANYFVSALMPKPDVLSMFPAKLSVAERLAQLHLK